MKEPKYVSRDISVIVLTVADVKFTLRSHNQGFLCESLDYELTIV